MDWQNIAAFFGIFTTTMGGFYYLFDKKFDKIDKKFDKIEERFDKIDDRLGTIEKDIHSIDMRLSRLEGQDEERFRNEIRLIARGD